jgi:hypothetical protein
MKHVSSNFDSRVHIALPLEHEPLQYNFRREGSNFDLAGFPITSFDIGKY